MFTLSEKPHLRGGEGGGRETECLSSGGVYEIKGAVHWHPIGAEPF